MIVELGPCGSSVSSSVGLRFLNALFAAVLVVEQAAGLAQRIHLHFPFDLERIDPSHWMSFAYLPEHNGDLVECSAAWFNSEAQGI